MTKSESLKQAWKSRKDYTFGLAGTKFHNSWRSMVTRCRGTAGAGSKKKYLNKGITYCEKWAKFKGFTEDMYPSYIEGMTLDRIDNSKGYFKENCRWATQSQQQNNRTNNAIISFNGKSQTLRHWSIELDVSINSLRLRYHNKYKKGKCSLEELMNYRGRKTISKQPN